MSEICSGNENHVVVNVYDEPNHHHHPPSSSKTKDSEMVFSVRFMQKVMSVCMHACISVHMYVLKRLYLSKEVFKVLFVSRLTSPPITEGIVSHILLRANMP